MTVGKKRGLFPSNVKSVCYSGGVCVCVRAKKGRERKVKRHQHVFLRCIKSILNRVSIIWLLCLIFNLSFWSWRLKIPGCLDKILKLFDWQKLGQICRWTNALDDWRWMWRELRVSWCEVLQSNWAYLLYNRERNQPPISFSVAQSLFMVSRKTGQVVLCENNNSVFCSVYSVQQSQQTHQLVWKVNACWKTV